MRNPIQRAFDPIKAEPELIYRTQQALVEERSMPDHRRMRHRRPLIRLLSAAMVVILLAGVVVVAGLAVMKTPVAAVSLDINPSITLRVNVLQRVVSATAHNKSGRQLLASDLVNKPVKSAVARLVAAAAAAGYLADDGSTIINITTSADSDNLKRKIGADTGNAASEALNGAAKKAVIYQNSTGLDRAVQARVLGITPGRLNLIQQLSELNDLNESSTIAKYKDMDNQAIMHEVVTLRKLKQEEAKAAKKSEKAGNAADPTGKPTAASVSDDESAYFMQMEQALAKAQENARQSGQQNPGKGNNGQGNK